MKITLILIKILFISALFIISTNNLYITHEADRGKFFDAYFMWLGDFFDNIKGLTLYVIKSHWLPENITIPKDNVSFPPG
jgi:hypothetical protein